MNSVPRLGHACRRRVGRPCEVRKFDRVGEDRGFAGRTDFTHPTSCCDVLNFFESAEMAQRYLTNNPELTGFTISISDAIAVGRTVFGDIFKED